MSLKDRHLLGAGAAACAVCCAAPVLAFVGVAGAAATVATMLFAGLTFGLVVAAAALLAVWRRRRTLDENCRSPAGPVDLEISPKPSTNQHEAV
jgi:membrane protein implicated in regulation of membrane protease activity